MNKIIKHFAFFMLLSILLAAGCGQLENLSKKGKLYIVPEDAVINSGETLQYSAIANSLIGQESSADVTNLVSWSSSDTGVAEIGIQTGLATAVGEGVTDITAEFLLVTNTGGVLDSYTMTETTSLTVNTPDSPPAPVCDNYTTPSNNWTKDTSAPIIDTGDSSTWDSVFAISPSVLYNCSSYQMWYAGYDGSNYSIGYATSSDGVNWTKYASNPVLIGNAGDWDSNGVSSPSVVFDGTTYHMIFSGNNATNWKLGYATSTDGVNWTKHASNPVVDFGAPGAWDDYALDHPLLYYTGSEFKLWYSGYDGSHYRVGYATSPDGSTWTKYANNPVLDVGSSGWDRHMILAEGLIYDGSTYYMWYSANDYAYWKMGFATSSDGIEWTKDASNPILESTYGAWDYYHTGWASVIFNGTGYEMFYTGGKNNSTRIGHATSD